MPMNECIFCKITKGEMKSWKVYETEFSYAFLDINPVSEFHTLVIPKKHYTDIFEIPLTELAHVVTALKYVTDLYHLKLGINDAQIVNSSGAHAQQDVFHFHFHFVPRFKGDGQDVKWKLHPEMRVRFDDLLEKIR
jgi:histidine triad (HIT) family protein